MRGTSIFLIFSHNDRRAFLFSGLARDANVDESESAKSAHRAKTVEYATAGQQKQLQQQSNNCALLFHSERSPLSLSSDQSRKRKEPAAIAARTQQRQRQRQQRLKMRDGVFDPAEALLLDEEEEEEEKHQISGKILKATDCSENAALAIFKTRACRTKVQINILVPARVIALLLHDTPMSPGCCTT